jgi:hypothetical protein
MKNFKSYLNNGQEEILVNPDSNEDQGKTLKLDEQQDSKDLSEEQVYAYQNDEVSCDDDADIVGEELNAIMKLAGVPATSKKKVCKDCGCKMDAPDSNCGCGHDSSDKEGSWWVDEQPINLYNNDVDVEEAVTGTNRITDMEELNLYSEEDIANNSQMSAEELKDALIADIDHLMDKAGDDFTDNDYIVDEMGDLFANMHLKADDETLSCYTTIRDMIDEDPANVYEAGEKCLKILGAPARMEMGHDIAEALKVGQKVKVKDNGEMVSGVITNVGSGKTLGVADVELPDGRINVYDTDKIIDENNEDTLQPSRIPRWRAPDNKPARGYNVNRSELMKGAKEKKKKEADQLARIRTLAFGEDKAIEESYTAIGKTFDEMFNMMGRLLKITRQDGVLSKMVDREGGDPAWITDANQKLIEAMEAIEEAHRFSYREDPSE